MTVILRFPRQLYEHVKADLSRPHPFAGERVGFLFGRLVNAGQPFESILLCTRYHSLADERYIDDPSSGARIDSQAIRGAMQQVLDRGEGVFHIHLHSWFGKPEFSAMDGKELPRLIPSFQAVGPALAHGLVLLSENECTAAIWMPGMDRPVEPKRIVIVGYPLQICGGRQ